MSPMRWALALCTATAMLLVPSRADAAGCTVSSPGVSFGAYNVYNSSPLDSTGSVTYNCTVAVLISIDLGKGASSAFDPRTLMNGADVLNYNLYTDAARSTIWGDGSSGTSHYTTLLSVLIVNTNVTVTIYGRIPALQDVSAGLYTDTVVMTINF